MFHGLAEEPKQSKRGGEGRRVELELVKFQTDPTQGLIPDVFGQPVSDFLDSLRRECLCGKPLSQNNFIIRRAVRHKEP